LTTLDEAVKVPDTLAELLSPEWLSQALQRRFPGTRVTGVIPGPVMTRISTNAFFQIECAGTPPAGLPTNLCAKGYFTDTGNSAYRAAGESESLFYRDLAASIEARTLPSVYADLDTDTRHGVVITEDIAAAGASFVDPLKSRSPAEVAATLELYAGMHGRTWNAPPVGQAEWLAPRIDTSLRVRGVGEIQAQFDGPLGTGVPKEARDAEGLVKAYTALTAITASSPSWCLIHGDAHTGNLFTDAGGRPGLLDWQLVQRGLWHIDVGYHIASSLSVEDRRRSEKDLLTRYLNGLISHGVEAPSWDEAWFGLCCGIVYGLFLWSITQRVRPEITTTLLGRLGTAAADHNVFPVVRPPSP
jgi:hypothetical protein